MDSARPDRQPAGLTRVWRRLLVMLTLGCVAGIVLLHLFAADRPRLLHTGEVAFALVAIACVWLLADSLRPWFGGDTVPAEERAHADAAVRQSYATLVWVAGGILIYLQVMDGEPLVASGGGPEEVLLWLVLALVFLLPGGIAAWEDVSDEVGATAVGPVALTMARLRGPWAGAYAAGMVALLMAGGLLLLLSNAASSRSEPLLEAASVGALLLLIGLIPLSLRSGGGRRAREARGRNG